MVTRDVSGIRLHTILIIAFFIYLLYVAQFLPFMVHTNEVNYINILVQKSNRSVRMESIFQET